MDIDVLERLFGQPRCDKTGRVGADGDAAQYLSLQYGQESLSWSYGDLILSPN